MITAVIVEDDEYDARQLLDILNGLRSDIKFALFESGEEALEYLGRKENHADIFFLDRELPGMDGFAVAEQIRAKEDYVLAPIVFVTGYEMNQLDAFQEYHCYSYILKPFDETLIKKRILALLNRLGKENRTAPMKKVLFLVGREGEAMVYPDQIYYLETMRRDCVIHLRERTYSLPRCSLDQQLEELDEPYIVRCHKSFAVNLVNVVHFNKTARNIWKPIFKGNWEPSCEISKTYYDWILERYNEMKKEKLDEDKR